MKKLINYVDSNIEKFINELSDYLRIPSISTLEVNKPDMINCANFVADRLREAGINDITIFPTEGHPIVYGELITSSAKPTVLVYGHYDVQPVDPVELWHSDPFEPIVKDNKIWARGATDDKGQLYAHIKSVQAYLNNFDELPVNIKFIVEGEEEIGSPNLEPFIKSHKELLKCDSVLISDTSLYSPGLPTITYALRGLCYMEVELTGPNRDLHSGTYGGGVANPANVLAKMIAGLHTPEGKVNIPGFYDDVVELTVAERENFLKLEHSDSEYAAELGIEELSGENGFTTIERTGARPTLDCNGIFGGFTGIGAKTVIPSKATAKLSMRLVANQDPGKIAELFEQHIYNIAPKSVKVKVTRLHGGQPAMVPIDSFAIKAAANAMQRAFGKETVFIREGGSIPVVATFARELEAPTVLMGLGLNSENLHSPNEHFDLGHFRLGILSSAYFFDEFAKGKNE